MRPHTLLPGAPLATAALLAGCSSDGPGPLGNGGTPGTQCVPGRLDHTLTMGIYDLDNTGKIPATVTTVRLTRARGLTITKSWLVPIYTRPGHSDDIGEQENYPPTSPEWAKRQPVPGAVVKPGQDLNVVFGLTRTVKGRWGRSDGPAITYTAGGTTYTIQEQTALQVASGRTCL